MGDKTEILTQYDIIQNSDNELMFALNAKNGAISNPSIIYAGGNEILFSRSQNQNILLIDVPTSVHELLKTLKKVLFIEVQDDSIVNEYLASVIIAPKLPK